MEGNGFGGNTKQTEFNSSKATLERVDELIKESNQLAKLSKSLGTYAERVAYLETWKINASCLYTSVKVKMKSSNKMRGLNWIVKLDKMGNGLRKVRTRKGLVKTINIPYFKKVWFEVFLFHLWLREMANKHGMLMTNKSVEFENFI